MKIQVCTALTLLLASCVEPAPHALIELNDPEELALNATAIAVANEAGVFRLIDTAGANSLTFTVVSPRSETEELLTFEAIGAGGELLARTHGRIFFPDGETRTYTLTLGAVCEKSDSSARTCRLSDASANGVCVAGRCQPTDCGDGIVDPDAASGPEQCDDGNLLSNDECTPECQFNVCGDGYRNKEREECDDGADSGNEDSCVIICSADECLCRLNVCGDGFLNRDTFPSGTPLEECDDANLNENDACLSTCRLNVCGDGVVHLGVEECDDANDNPNDGCDTCVQTAWSTRVLFGPRSPGAFSGPTPTGGVFGRLNQVVDIAWSPPNSLIVVEHGGQQLYRLDFASNRLMPISGRAEATSGDDGPVAFSTFGEIARVAVSANGSIAISDRSDHRVRVLDAATGTIDTVLGLGISGNPGGAFGDNIVDGPTGVTFDGDNVLFVDEGNRSVRAVPPAPQPTGFGSAPMSGEGLVVTELGVIYVADSNAGVLLVSDGTTVSGFSAPTDVALHPDGRVLVLDSNRVIAVDPSDSNSLTPLAGTGANGFSPDGTTALSADFLDLVAIAVDQRPGQDRIYLAESGSGLIRVIESGELETVWGDTNETRLPELSTNALQFAELGGIDSDGEGGFFLSDTGDGLVYRVNNNSVRIFAGTPPTLAGAPGPGDSGPATQGALLCPVGVRLASDGTAYIPDRCANAVRIVAPDGTISTADLGSLSDLQDATLDAQSRLIVSDANGLRRFDGTPTLIATPIHDRIEQLQRVGDTLYFLDVDLEANAVASSALRTASGPNFSDVSTVTIVSGMTAYAVDETQAVHYVTAAGTLYRFVGNGPDVLLNSAPGTRGDGGSLENAGFADLSPPPRRTTSMRALGDALYVADSGFGVFRRIENDRITSSIGRVHETDGRFPYASLIDPLALIALSDGTWLVADGGRVLEIDGDRVTTRLGYPDGNPINTSPQPAAFAALLGRASGIARVSDELIYVVDELSGQLLELTRTADSTNWSVRERLINLNRPSALATGTAPDGTLSLYLAESGDHSVSRIRLDTFEIIALAGRGAGFVDSESGELARFNEPRALAVDAQGVVFVADRRNHRIREIECDAAESCSVTTLLGGSIAGRLANEARAIDARTELPHTLAFDAFGNLLIGSDQELALVLADTDGHIHKRSPVTLLSSSEQPSGGCYSGAAWNMSGERFVVLDACQRVAVQGESQ